ncbi:MAG TPA: UDP-N-acetylmuramate dehydrogenase [Pyrinomonadaceae bacterium]|nr:UDP-N-acetylmuramate dehydrogenase [Pyrinomonadaceae bacterium]
MGFEVIENYALAPLTTLKVGGAARFFVRAKDENEIAEAVNFARKRDLPIFVLGGGSNVLISDEGFDGLVLKIANRGIEVVREENNVRITAQAGEDWDEFVHFCVEENLAGVECLSGIPGSVGGTPVQNVGAYGQEVAETIVCVRVLERASGKFFDLSNADCCFAYRSSIFNTTERDRFIVLAVSFVLQPNGEPAIRSKDLQQFFALEKPNLKETRDAVLQIRRAKSMVIATDDPNSQSAGSFFKNPVVETEKFARIAEIAHRLKFIENKSLPPHFPAGENSVKIPAAWLIEKAGFQKGYTKNNRAGISSNHTLAIVNRGAANASDILDLAKEIQLRVWEVFGVELKPEPVFVGF